MHSEKNSISEKPKKNYLSIQVHRIIRIYINRTIVIVVRENWDNICERIGRKTKNGNCRK